MIDNILHIFHLCSYHQLEKREYHQILFLVNLTHVVNYEEAGLRSALNNDYIWLLACSHLFVHILTNVSSRYSINFVGNAAVCGHRFKIPSAPSRVDKRLSKIMRENTSYEAYDCSISFLEAKMHVTRCEYLI